VVYSHPVIMSNEEPDVVFDEVALMMDCLGDCALYPASTAYLIPQSSDQIDLIFWN